MSQSITGRTAGEIAASIRHLVDSGVLGPGAMLPPVRQLATELGVNRNTVVAAYRQLILARVTVARRRGGTSIAEPTAVATEGFIASTTLTDVGSGNPDRALIPDLNWALPAAVEPHQLYGESPIDPDLAAWATEWIASEHRRKFRLSITSGAVDAVERLLAQSLTFGDRVAIEDPCFLSSINTIRLGGYAPLAVPVDDEGMTVEGLRAALAADARAVICTPRAHNPTGVSLSKRRAAALRAVLAAHPHVLVIEDDHFSMLARSSYHTLIGRSHTQWALVRSVSKFLGPDMRLAFVASDSTTAERLAQRIGPGTTWVSHILQRLTYALLSDTETQNLIANASDHYAVQNQRFVTLLEDRGIRALKGDGLNVWVDVQASGNDVNDELKKRGWLARSGDMFRFATEVADTHLRLTVHTLDPTAQVALATDLAAAIKVVSERRTLA